MSKKEHKGRPESAVHLFRDNKHQRAETLHYRRDLPKSPAVEMRVSGLQASYTASEFAELAAAVAAAEAKVRRDMSLPPLQK